MLLIERYLVTAGFFLLEMRARTEIGWKQNAKCEIFLFQEGGMDTEAAADI